MSVVWAAFRERNFEVGKPFLRARSVPSTVVKISHIRKRETHFFNKKSYFISFSSPYPFSSPFVCHLLATYLHRNLIGISPNDERIIKQLLPRLKQLSFDMIFPYTLQKKSHSPCAYAIFLLPLRSNLLHRIYYENNHHYPSSNYGT